MSGGRRWNASRRCYRGGDAAAQEVELWFCLLLSVPSLVVAQSEFRTPWSRDPLPEYLSAVGMAIPGLLHWLAAAWALSRRGIVVALAASLMACGLIFIGMFYEAGLETGMLIYLVAAAVFGVNLLYTRRRTAASEGPGNGAT